MSCPDVEAALAEIPAVRKQQAGCRASIVAEIDAMVAAIEQCRSTIVGALPGPVRDAARPSAPTLSARPRSQRELCDQRTSQSRLRP